MSYALLFPGQGTQHAGMLPWLDLDAHAQPVLGELASVIGPDWRAHLQDVSWATRNDIAQCLLTGISLAAWQAIAASLPRPLAVAGYSVGEISAYSAAGVMDHSQALAFASQRARAMDRAGGGVASGLLSVVGLTRAPVEALCSRLALSIAIQTGDDRYVLGGPNQALDEAMVLLAGSGASVKRLCVRVASHTPAMRNAAAEITAILEPLDWKNSDTLVINNLDAMGRRDARELKKALANQTDHTVQWDRCMDAISERRPLCVLEVGPGNSLTRMWQERFPDIPARSLDDFQSKGAAIAWTRKALAPG